MTAAAPSTAKSTAELAAEQAAHWNGPGGQNWLKAQARLDHLMAGITRHALALANAQPGEAAIDVGCGPGTTTAALAAAVGPEGQVLGVDISRVLIDAAATRRLSNATFVVADAGSHPFEAASVDLIFSRFGVMFFADPVRAFTNIAGGRLREPAACAEAVGSACLRLLAQRAGQSLEPRAGAGGRAVPAADAAARSGRARTVRLRRPRTR